MAVGDECVISRRRTTNTVPVAGVQVPGGLVHADLTRSLCFQANRVPRRLRYRLIRGPLPGGIHRSLPSCDVQIPARLIHQTVAERRGLHGDRGILLGIGVSQRRMQLRYYPPQLIGQLRVGSHQASQPALPLPYQSLLGLLIPDLPNSKYLSTGLLQLRLHGLGPLPMHPTP